MPKYEMIYRRLLGRIESGQYTPGSLLPGEYELMKQFDVSRDTVRKALLLLAQNGYIQKTQGKGSVILNGPRYDFPVSGVVSFKELKGTLGKEARTEVICLEQIQPDARLKNKLETNPGELVWLLQRVRVIDQERVILDTDFIRTSVVPKLTREIAEDSIYEYMEQKMGLKIACAKKEITCQNVSAGDEQYLDLKGYSMVVNVESSTWLEDSRVFQFTQSRHRPDKFRFLDFARRRPGV